MHLGLQHVPDLCSLGTTQVQTHKQLSESVPILSQTKEPTLFPCGHTWSVTWDFSSV